MTVELSPEDKVRLLRDLTRGADDVFASRRDGAWGPVYGKLTDEIVLQHLMGNIEIGSYPLIPFGNGDYPNVMWICADFDGKTCKQCKEGNPRGADFCTNCEARLPDWQADVQKAVEFLLDSECCLFVNLSRSAQGAHVRVLFNEPVPAWLARRWMTAWLEEASVIGSEDDWDIVPPSFDRLIPPQDWLTGRLNKRGNRMPGNLAGNPLNGRRARQHNGGTLPLDPYRVLKGDFDPDGRHWDHVIAALESREWGRAELQRAMTQAPGAPSTVPPSPQAFDLGSGGQYRSLPVLQGSDRSLEYMVKFCEFVRHMQQPGAQTYQLWVALATELHRFGEDGRQAFHEISSADSRYNASDTDKKWEQTQGMRPVRCDTLVTWGYRCPHLATPRCNGAGAPTYFTDHTDAEIL